MKWAEELRKEYRKTAEENQRATQFGGEANICPTDKGKVRDKIAKDLNMGSGETYRKAQYIYNNAPQDMIKDLDDEKLSINKAYNTLKAQLQAEKDKAVQLERQLKQEQCKPPRGFILSQLCSPSWGRLKLEISEDEKLKKLLATNFGRLKNDPVKQGRVFGEYEKLCGVYHGNHINENGKNCLSQEQIAKELGVSVRTLRNLKQLNKLSPDLQELISDGTVKYTTALSVWSKLSEEEQSKLIEDLD